MYDTLVVITIKKHKPLVFTISINTPRFGIVEKTNEWLSEHGYQFKEEKVGSTMESPEPEFINLAIFRIAKSRDGNIDDVIGFLQKETRDVYVIDTFFNKNIPVMQLPSGRIVAAAK